MATQVGSVIDGKYEILKQIGKGGMSVVYLAMDKRLNKQWAIKEIKKTSNGKNDEVIVNSLIAEANLMKRLDHPALPRIVDIIDNGRTLYVVMDYIEGESLDKILLEYGAQPEKLVLTWAMQLCDALGYLHAQKPPIIYRDMKPANVMLKPEGNLKVIDFGIAREYKEQNLSDTTVLGTKGYAPPEQHGSRQTDARSDIYALGMTMHHLLTGVDPRPADYMYVPVRQWNPELSEGIEEIINKCTALDPENRYQNCDELMYDLQHPDQIGQGIKKQKKRKLTTFIVTSLLTLLMLGTGFGSQALKTAENDKDYEMKINPSSSVSYEERVSGYLEAIDLYGADTRAYMKLLEAYQEDDVFDKEESNQFAAKFNMYRSGFDMNSEAYWDLLYEMGVAYMYTYSGNDGSFRNNILKAQGFFDDIVASANADYANYNIAETYSKLCGFYKKYVIGGGRNEPNREAYEELLDSFDLCIENLEEYSSDDSAYVKLTMYREIVNMLNDHRKGFANTGIEKDIVLQMLDTVIQNTERLSVTQDETTAILEAITGLYEEYKDNIERAYENTAERNR